jgi:hypothetical protein
MRLAVALACLLSPAFAAPPLEVGLGVATWSWFGPVSVDQPIHPSLVLTFDRVADRAWLRENPDDVPDRLRDRLGAVEEVRLRPHPWLPESIVISPRLRETGMIGASWRPLAVGAPIVTGPVRVGVEAGARLTTLVMWSRSLPSVDAPKSTFFLRPGVDVALDASFPLADDLRLRVGLDAHAYLPQKIGGFGLGGRGERMGAVGRALVEARYRL